MVDIFPTALKFVLKWEGGYVNNPNDLGGETNKGITKNTYDAYRKSYKLKLQSVKLISDKEVSEIYYRNYWLKAGCDKLAPKLAVVHFDTAVNMGITRANTFLKACGGSIDNYIFLRRQKYEQFAKVKGQEIFLKGWLNRLNNLEQFLKTIK